MIEETIPNTEGFRQCRCHRMGCTHGGTNPSARGERCNQGAELRYVSTGDKTPAGRTITEMCESCAVAVGMRRLATIAA